MKPGTLTAVDSGGETPVFLASSPRISSMVGLAYWLRRRPPEPALWVRVPVSAGKSSGVQGLEKTPVPRPRGAKIGGASAWTSRGRDRCTGKNSSAATSRGRDRWTGNSSASTSKSGDRWTR
eukprot:3613854-Amphidinium_carterae.1